MTEPGSLTLWVDNRLYSPWVLSVWVMLKEKGVPFSVKAVELYQPDSAGIAYAERAWNGKIPALEHEGLFVGESLAILEYLEEVFPAPRYRSLLPDSPAGRAEEREILSWLRTDLVNLRECFPFEGFFEPVTPAALTDDAREEIERLIALVERRAAHGAPGVTIADIELAYTLHRLVHYGFDLSNHPRVSRFHDALWAGPSVRSWFEHKRPINPRPGEFR